MKYQLAIKNFPAQQSVFDCPARFTVVAKGRRFGLTRGAANDIIKKSLQGAFQKGLWVDTVNANIERYVERYFLPHLHKLPQTMWAWRKQQKILEIKNTYIDFRSADNPYNIEGFGYDYAFLNEAGIILRNEYLWNNAIRPMFWENPKSRVIVGGAPKGKGIFFELFQRGQDPNQPNFNSFRFTSFDNPYIDTKLIMEDMKSMPQRVVEQEIYAQFLDDTGVVFRGVKEIATLQPKDPLDGHLYVIGCDLARVQDYTVIAVYDRATNEQVFQMRFNELEWPTVKERIKMVSRKYNNALVILDSTGVGDPIYLDLVRDTVPVEPMHFTNEQKKQLIEKLSNWIELQYIKMLQLDETIHELLSFTYDISERSGRVIYGAPVGFHDDIVIAHALAVWGLQPLIKQKEEALTLIQRDFKNKVEKYNNDDEYEFEEI